MGIYSKNNMVSLYCGNLNRIPGLYPLRVNEFQLVEIEVAEETQAESLPWENFHSGVGDAKPHEVTELLFQLYRRPNAVQ